MKQWLSLLIFVPALWAQSGENILPDESFRGWTRLPWMDLKLDPASQWRVDPSRGVLICEGNRGHEWLRYDRELADFRLHVEWRLVKVEGGKGYNSGVFLRTAADMKIWHQAQIGSLNGGYLFGTALVSGSPQRFNLRDQIKEMRVKEAGEWNVYDVTAQGQKLSVVVNGGLTSEYDRCETPKGYIGLEAEGFQIEFRNLSLSVLR